MPDESSIVPVLGLDVVKIKHGNENQRGQSGSEATVVEHETAVHTHRGGGNGRVEHTRKHTVFESVFAGNGTQTRREGKRIDIRLGGKRPRHIQTRYKAYTHHECPEKGVSHDDREDVSRVLSVCGKRQCGKHDAHSRARKAYAGREHGEYVGQDEHKIQVGDTRHAVYGNIDHTQRHAEFIGKIRAVARAFQKLTVLPYLSAVHEKSRKKRKTEQSHEKGVHEPPIRIRHRVVRGVFDGHDRR